MKLRTGFVAALIFAFSGTVACSDQTGADRNTRPRDVRQVRDALTAFGRQELSRTPETASRLGLHALESAMAYERRLDDRSQAAFERARLERLEALETLQRLPQVDRPRDVKIALESTREILSSVVEMATFGHGQTSLGFVRPYAVDPLAGAYIDLPDLLINRQIIQNREDALAYLDRLDGLAGAIDDDRRRLLADAASGVTPPDFILRRMADLADRFMTTDSTAEELVLVFENLVQSTGDIPAAEMGRMVNHARETVFERIIPAYGRLKDTALEMAETAQEAPGVWAIRDGETYYEAALNFYTGGNQSPDALHEEGLAVVDRISEDLDKALQTTGLGEGTVGERLALLGTRADQIYPDDDAGRAAILTDLNQYIADAQPLMADIVVNAPATPIAVTAVPDFLAPQAPGGYYAAAPADGSAPAVFFINLRNTAEWPAFMLPTLAYHEAIPGHHLENTMIETTGQSSIVRQLIWLPAFGEGWALYAEDLADEMGAYTENPYGRIGYLQSLLFRAARLVTDTGIHQKQWSYETAVDYLVETTGQPRSAMETEVERYAVWPGQAASYMVGRQFIWSMRQRAQKALGRDFNLLEFHQIILTDGPRPLSMVEEDIDAWIAAQTAE